MRVDRFDFELPPDRIAMRPVRPRDSARLLACLKAAQSPCAAIPGAGFTGAALEKPSFGHHLVRDLPGLLRSGDLLVFNDTRVIPAQLSASRLRDGMSARVRLTLANRVNEGCWQALVRPAKRMRTGDRLHFDGSLALTAQVTAIEPGGLISLVFDRSGKDLDLAIEANGAMPLPPYIAGRRPPDSRDREDYQTIYSRVAGAVAAPTAGLHFTAPLLARLQAAGIGHVFVTLHVGPGTFLPVRATDTDDHRMHAEWGEVGADAADRIAAARERGGRIVAVGTTALRLLEAAAAGGTVAPFSGKTDIFITPGYRFRAVDLLFTNFHLPKSTLVMLVAAFLGLERTLALYSEAVVAGYRFYSYGDASLLERRDPDDPAVPA